MRPMPVIKFNSGMKQRELPHGSFQQDSQRAQACTMLLTVSSTTRRKSMPTHTGKVHNLATYVLKISTTTAKSMQMTASVQTKTKNLVSSQV